MTDYSPFVIACDYDGTLTWSDNEVHPGNIEAVREFVQAGGTFCLATGKSPREIDPRLMELASASVFCSGGIVYDPQEGHTLTTWPLPADAIDLARRIYAELPTRGVGLACEDASYCLRYDPSIMPTEFVERNLCMVGPDDLEALRGKVLSINTHGSEETRIAVEQMVDTGYPSCTHEVSFPQFVDITPRGVSKGTGLAYLRKQVFASKTFLAVGDNENDLEMIDEADVGFCMGNGANELKRHADVILPDRQHPCVRGVMDWMQENGIC